MDSRYTIKKTFRPAISVPPAIFAIILLATMPLFSQSDDNIKDLSEMTIEELMQVDIISASKDNSTVSEIPASVYIIERSEIERLGYVSMSEILRHIGGYVMIDDYHYLGHKNYSVRGFFSSGAFGNVIILVNGVPQLSDEYMEYPDTKITVPVEAIDRIEIVQGPMAVSYGNGAFFGAVNIITNSATDDNEISGGIGNYNHFKAFSRYSGKVDDIEYRLNLGYSKTNGIDVPFSELTSDNDILVFAGVTPETTTGGMLESNSRYFDMSFRQHGGLFGNISYNESINEVMDGMPSIGEGSEISHFATNINLGYQSEIYENINFKGLFGYYMHSHNLDYEILFENSFGLDATKSRAFDIDIALNGDFCDNQLHVLLGYYNRNVVELYQIADFPSNGLSRGDGEILLPRDDMITVNSLYGQAKYNLLDKLDIIAGLRIEHLSPYGITFTRGVVAPDSSGYLPTEDRIIKKGEFVPRDNGLAITPRFALLYKINTENIVKAMYGSAVKQPTFIDNLRQFMSDRPYLEVQKIETFELNYVRLTEGKCRANISIFYNHLHDLITANNEFSPETGWNVFSANTGQLETFGTEVCLKYDFDFGLSAASRFLYQNTKNLKKGYEDIKPGYSPDFTGNISLTRTFAEKYHISFSAQYVDNMETAWVTSTTPEEGRRLGDSIEEMLLFDANIRVDDIFDTGLYADLAVKNVLNHEIRYPTTSSNTWIDKGTLGFGRQVIFNIGLKF